MKNDDFGFKDCDVINLEKTIDAINELVCLLVIRVILENSTLYLDILAYKSTINLQL